MTMANKTAGGLWESLASLCYKPREAPLVKREPGGRIYVVPPLPFLSVLAREPDCKLSGCGKSQRAPSVEQHPDLVVGMEGQDLRLGPSSSKRGATTELQAEGEPTGSALENMLSEGMECKPGVGRRYPESECSDDVAGEKGVVVLVQGSDPDRDGSCSREARKEEGSCSIPMGLDNVQEGRDSDGIAEREGAEDNVARRDDYPSVGERGGAMDVTEEAGCDGNTEKTGMEDVTQTRAEKPDEESKSGEDQMSEIFTLPRKEDHHHVTEADSAVEDLPSTLNVPDESWSFAELLSLPSDTDAAAESTVLDSAVHLNVPGTVAALSGQKGAAQNHRAGRAPMVLQEETGGRTGGGAWTQLTDEQVKAFREVFELACGHRGRSIASPGLKTTLRAVGIRLGTAQLRLSLQRADSDGDGEVGFEDFLKVMTDSKRISCYLQNKVPTLLVRFRAGQDLDTVFFHLLARLLESDALSPRSTREIVRYYHRRCPRRGGRSGRGAQAGAGAGLLGLSPSRLRAFLEPKDAEGVREKRKSPPRQRRRPATHMGSETKLLTTPVQISLRLSSKRRSEMTYDHVTMVRKEVKEGTELYLRQLFQSKQRDAWNFWLTINARYFQEREPEHIWRAQQPSTAGARPAGDSVLDQYLKIM